MITQERKRYQGSVGAGVFGSFEEPEEGEEEGAESTRDLSGVSTNNFGLFWNAVSEKWEVRKNEEDEVRYIFNVNSD